MSVTFRCDFCGHPIDDDDMRVTVRVDGREWRDERSEFVNYVWGHYHSQPVGGQPSCWAHVLDALELQETYANIERIPVASGQRIAAMRRKHNRPNAGGK